MDTEVSEVIESKKFFKAHENSSAVSFLIGC